MSPKSLIASLRSVLSLSSLRNDSSYESKLDESDPSQDRTGLRQKRSEESAAEIELGDVEEAHNSIRVTKRFEAKVEERV